MGRDTTLILSGDQLLPDGLQPNSLDHHINSGAGSELGALLPVDQARPKALALMRAERVRPHP